MLKINCTILVYVVLIPLFTNATAQQVIIEAEIRPRSEFRHGYSKPLGVLNDPGIFTSQRSRLSFGWNSGHLNTLITLQDARIFGQDSQSHSSSTVGVYEAWADLLLAPGLWFKIGRQALSYDDSRLFSAPAWSLTGTAHDLALLKFRQNDFQLHIGSAYNNRTAINTEAFYMPGARYRMMNYLWFSYRLSKPLSVSGILIDEAIQDTMGVGYAYKRINMNHLLTYGGNLSYNNPDVPVSGLLTAYFQSGRNEKNILMKGRMLAFKVNYLLNKTVNFSFGTDYFSGDSNGSADNVMRNFRKLYGADHTFNGYMDYWNTPVPEGLLDYYGCLRMKFSKRLTAEAGFHSFYADHALKNAGAETGKDLGSELDILFTFKLNDQSTFQLGYCRYFATENTKLAKDIPHATTIRSPQWAYVMFTFRPVFISSKSDCK